MNNHTGLITIIIVCIISIHCQNREPANQLDTLPQAIRDTCIHRLVVIRRQHQNTSGHRIHNIRTRLFHNHVSCKIGRQNTVFSDDLHKLFIFAFRRHFPHQKQVSNLFKPKLIFIQIAYKIFYLISTIP